jgi:hypothetical protein
MKHTLPTLDRERLSRRIASFLSRQYNEILTAYIFGSFVQVDAFSDIDIGLIVGDVIPNLLEFELTLEDKIRNLVNYHVDVRVLNNAPIAFSQNVFRTGRVILDKNPNFRADFEGLILKKFFDFAPFRRRYLKDVFDALV